MVGLTMTCFSEKIMISYSCILGIHDIMIQNSLEFSITLHFIARPKYLCAMHINYLNFLQFSEGMRNIDEAGYTMAKSAVVTLTRSFGQKGRNGPWKKDGIKGQLISKGLFDVIVSTKKTTKCLKDFCPSLLKDHNK